MAEFAIRPTPIPGCIEIEIPRSSDRRGSFVKAFQSDAFAKAGVALRVDEVFHSTSRRGVLRGLHFQVPPAPLVKLVWCVAG